MKILLAVIACAMLAGCASDRTFSMDRGAITIPLPNGQIIGGTAEGVKASSKKN